MGNTCRSHGSFNDHKYIASSKRKLPRLLLESYASSVRAQSLKSIAFDIINHFEENSQLESYTDPLKKFVNEYDYTKLVDFFENLSQLGSQKEKTLDFGDKNTSADFKGEKSNAHNFTFAGSYSDGKLMDSTTVLFANDEALNFSQQLFQKDSFFCELTVLIGELYSKKYGQELTSFEALIEQLSDLDPYTHFEFQIDKETRQHIETIFGEARRDIRQFEDLIFNFIKLFVSQISFLKNGDESLVPSDQNIQKMGLQILFGENKCYSTIFSMIRYHTIEEEMRLRNSFIKLRKERPDAFSVEPKFCLEKEAIPYERVISHFKQLDNLNNPNDKFYLIFQARQEILKCINQYRASYNSDENETQNYLTGEDLLPLFTYCLSQTWMKTLKAHQVFIETLLEKEAVAFDDQGYCFSTYEGAIDSLLSDKEMRESLKDSIRRLSVFSEKSFEN